MNDPIGFSDFRGSECYELWLKGELIGLCDIWVSGLGSTDGGSATLTGKLESVYVSRRYRGRGFTRYFLETVGHHVFQRVVTGIVSTARKGCNEVSFSFDADIYSYGGQAATVILGETICDSLDFAKPSLGVTVTAEFDADGW